MNGSNSPADPPAAGPVLLFDGECGLCRFIVRGLLRWDRAGRLRFAPLQGAAAQAYLRHRGLPLVDFDTLVFVPNWNQRDAAGPLLRTDGVVASLRVVGGATALTMAAALHRVPRAWRDAAYRLVARWRRRLFGAGSPGPWLRTAWRGRVLD